MQNIVQEKFNTVKNKRLWNPKWFLPIAIFFSFLPVAIIYSLNVGRLGFLRKRNYYLLMACAIFVTLTYIGTLIPENSGRSIIYGLNIGLAVLLKNDQMKVYQKHIENGGKSASYVIPIITSIILSSALIGVLVYSWNVPDTKMTFKGDDLYYTNSVTQDEVKKLGKYLAQGNFFKNDSKNATVKIDKKSGEYIFSIILNEKYLNDAEVAENVKILAKTLSEDVFQNKTVKINLCNERFGVEKTISY